MTSQRGQIYINYGSNLNIENKEIERERENFATLWWGDIDSDSETIYSAGDMREWERVMRDQYILVVEVGLIISLASSSIISA